MKLLQLRYFKTVSETENISQAAKILRIPQPALSRTIARLESELGAKLFDRSGNRIYLNSQGRRFASLVTETLQKLDAGLANFLDENLHGELHLLVLQHRSTIIDCIAAFKQQFPRVSFVISHDEQNKRKDSYDLCISSSAPGYKKYESLPLIREEIRLAVSQNHPLAEFTSVKIPDLKEESFLSLGNDTSLTKMASAACEKHGFIPRFEIECNDLFCLKKYVSIGLGVAFVPAISWRELFGSDVRLLTINEKDFNRNTYVFRDIKKDTSALISEFCSYLQHHFTNLQSSYTN